jgi:hypothetical protein
MVALLCGGRAHGVKVGLGPSVCSNFPGTSAAAAISSKDGITAEPAGAGRPDVREIEMRLRTY